MQRLVALGARWIAFLINLLPTRPALRLGAAVGLLSAHVSLRRREIALVNLRIAFPEWTEERRRRVMREAFANLGRVVAESAQLENLAEEEVLARTTVVGEENLRQALRTSKAGVIVITAHVGNWELLGRAMALRGYPLTVVYRSRENPYIESFLKEWRTKLGFDVIARGVAARGVLRALRAGRVVALQLDQNVNRREGVFVPFFGRLACTRTGPSRIAMRTGAPVIPAFIRRVDRGPNHLILVHPPLELVAADEPDAVARNLCLINAAIESAVRAAPDQWTWSHRRWKTQPEGEARPYRSKRGPGPLASLLLKRSHV
jgi:KDO2-lipid IV(A) lauroyltransferase